MRLSVCGKVFRRKNFPILPRRLFKELCSSLEHDYGGDPGDQIRSETLIRLNIVDEKTARKSRNAPLVKTMNERLKQKKAANKKTDV